MSVICFFDSRHSIILVIKSHILIIDTFYSMVANGNFVGVSSPNIPPQTWVLPKGFLAKTTQGFFHNSCLICSYFIGSFSLSFSQNFALKTFDKAFTGNRNLPSRLLFCHCPFLSTPPPGTMQCKCGCRDKLLSPSVQNGNHSRLHFFGFAKLF